MDNTLSHMYYIVGQRNGIFKVFSDNCGLSVLFPYQNLGIRNLKLDYIKNKCWSVLQVGSSTHAWLCNITSNWESLGSLNPVDLPNTYIFHPRLSKATSLILPPVSSQKSLHAGKLLSSEWQRQVLPNSSFYLKAPTFLLTTNTASCFL